MASGSQSRVPLEPRAFIDGVRAFVWSCGPDGFPEFLNQRFLDYSGLTAVQFYKWRSALHPDDVEAFETWWQGLIESPKIPDKPKLAFAALTENIAGSRSRQRLSTITMAN